MSAAETRRPEKRSITIRDTEALAFAEERSRLLHGGNFSAYLTGLIRRDMAEGEAATAGDAVKLMQQTDRLVRRAGLHVERPPVGPEFLVATPGGTVIAVGVSSRWVDTSVIKLPQVFAAAVVSGASRCLLVVPDSLDPVSRKRFEAVSRDFIYGAIEIVPVSDLEEQLAYSC